MPGAAGGFLTIVWQVWQRFGVSEAVWKLAEHRYIYTVRQPQHVGHARRTLYVGDLDALVTQIADRGLLPVEREIYSNGVRKITYRDLDGNEIGFGGAPL
jgi:hypothetical protein